MKENFHAVQININKSAAATTAQRRREFIKLVFQIICPVPNAPSVFLSSVLPLAN